MTIDLSTLKPGDTVHFRCGGSAVVVSVIKFGGLTRLTFTAANNPWIDYYNVGRYAFHGDSPFDIVSVTPKKEPIVGYVNVYPKDGSWKFGQLATCIFVPDEHDVIKLIYDPETKQARVEVVE